MCFTRIEAYLLRLGIKRSQDNSLPVAFSKNLSSPIVATLYAVFCPVEQSVRLSKSWFDRCMPQPVLLAHFDGFIDRFRTLGIWELERPFLAICFSFETNYIL